MKKKKIEKLVRILAHELQHRDRPMKVQEQIDWSDYDKEASEKFKKMFLQLLSHRDNIRLDINEDCMSIQTDDVTSIRKSSKRGNTLNSDENYLRIDVSKTGFQINKGYRQRTNYLDPDIYYDLLDKAKDSQRKYNSEVFNEVWSEIMKESGVARDHNLDELFNG